MTRDMAAPVSQDVAPCQRGILYWVDGMRLDFHYMLLSVLPVLFLARSGRAWGLDGWLAWRWPGAWPSCATRRCAAFPQPEKNQARSRLSGLFRACVKESARSSFEEKELLRATES